MAMYLRQASLPWDFVASTANRLQLVNIQAVSNVPGEALPNSTWVILTSVSIPNSRFQITSFGYDACGTSHEVILIMKNFTSNSTNRTSGLQVT